MGYVAADRRLRRARRLPRPRSDGATGLVFFVGSFAAIVGLNVATARGREQLAIGLLFGLGLLLGLAVAPVITDYAGADPSALWQAAGATAAFVAGLGAYGYATRRDLSSWARPLFWALLGADRVRARRDLRLDPGRQRHLRRGRLVIFGGFTIVDFNRLRHEDEDSAVLIAASIFLDVFNVFLLFLDLFGGSRD